MSSATLVGCRVEPISLIFYSSLLRGEEKKKDLNGLPIPFIFTVRKNSFPFNDCIDATPDHVRRVVLSALGSVPLGSLRAW
ncbi:hypothetical protein SKAU_G00024660 [Synaphobranchus kaupii]|uniref:Uncharacterized protein n=1 Tax=Synaphobranchus kaupii TaxID=118154 RepID=A0A9Q1JDG9_SYNKA|nr:hypothetical protein SKAU_G00024660 [Synaphobranchus kaupii]